MSDLSRRSFLAAAGAAVAAPLLRAAPAPYPGEPKFKLGLVTYNVAKDWDLPTILRMCKEVGVAAVECRTTHKHGVEPTLSADQRKDVKKQFADSGVVVLGLRQRVRVPLRRPGRGAEEHRGLQAVRRSGHATSAARA